MTGRTKNLAASQVRETHNHLLPRHFILKLIILPRQARENASSFAAPHFINILKLIILPRQARDKQQGKQHSKRDAVFAGELSKTFSWEGIGCNEALSQIDIKGVGAKNGIHLFLSVFPYVCPEPVLAK